MTATLNPLEFSDADLSRTLESLRTEAHRRATVATVGDSGAAIRGQEMGKRAALVAAAGGFSILFIGPAGQGKTMLRAMTAELGDCPTFEARPCPCGNKNNPHAVCNCTPAAVARHWASLPVAQMSVEVSTVPQRELQSKLTGTTAADLRERIKAMGPEVPAALSTDCATLLKYCATEFGFSPSDCANVTAIAQTIASLESAKAIHAAHISEAINYRTLIAYAARNIVAA